MVEESEWDILREITRLATTIQNIEKRIEELRNERTEQTKLTREDHRTEIKGLENRLIETLKDKVDKSEFGPVRTLVYGFVGVALMALILALLRPITGG